MTKPLTDNPDQTLTKLRIAWTALLLSHVIFLLVMTVILKPGSSGAIEPGSLRTLLIASIGFMIITIPGGYMFRMQNYKRHWRVSAVTPAGYFMGNLVLFAMCESTAMFAVVVTHLAGTFIPYIIPAAVAAGTMMLNFPDGKPMRPREPELMR
jgi:hypothetical protein